MASVLPHIVIIGASFSGLACARALLNANVTVTVIDRRNYHLFAPLVYQVATAIVSPGESPEPAQPSFRDGVAGPGTHRR